MTSVPETGEWVTYEVVIRNLSPETVTLDAITDRIGDGDPLDITGGPGGLVDPPPTELAPAGSDGDTYVGYLSRWVEGEAPGSVTDTVKATASDNDGNSTDDQDDATVDLVDVSIDIEKATNGQNDPAEDGGIDGQPEILVGSPVTWTYTVTNDGDWPLSGITVTDPKAGVITAPAGWDGTLDPDESAVFTATGTATAGQYENTGKTTGKAYITETAESGTVSDSDMGHYVGLTPGFTIEKQVTAVKAGDHPTADTVWKDADSTPGPEVLAGSHVYFRVVLVNTGETDLSLALSDASFPRWTPTVTLAAGETQAVVINPDDPVTATGVAGVAITNTAQAIASAEDDFDNTWTDTKSNVANYNVINPAMSLVKYVGYDADGNGSIGTDEWWDANDQASGIKVVAETPLTVKFVVENTGDTPLTGVECFDSVNDADPTSAGTLGVGETEKPKEIGPAQAGWNHDVGHAETTKTDDFGNSTAVTSNTDPAHYFGATLAIDIDKQIALSASGPWLDDLGTIVVAGAGQPPRKVYYRFIVTNNSNVPLSNVVVDDPTLGFTRNIGELTVGQSVTIPDPPLSADVEYGAHTNTVTATGRWTDTANANHSASDADTASYTGAYAAYTPGYWKNHPEVWKSKTGYIPTTAYGTPTRVKDVFTVPNTLYGGLKKSRDWLGNATLMEALAFPGDTTMSGGAQILLRVGTGALLNAAAMGSGTGVTYPLTKAQVIEQVNTALNSGDRAAMITLANLLDGYNNGTHTGL